MILAGIYDSNSNEGIDILGTPKSILVNMHYDASIYIKDDDTFWHRFYYINFMFEDECIIFYTFYTIGYAEDVDERRSKKIENIIDELNMDIRPNIRIVTYGDNEKDPNRVNIFLQASETEVKDLLKYIRHVNDDESIIFNCN